MASRPRARAPGRARDRRDCSWGRRALPAEEWGGIEPGITTIEQVRARYGAPSKETRAKEQGHDTIQWVFEDARAPGGIQRLTVDYGLLTPQGYKQTVVRAFRLEPKPKVFGKNTVAQAWGPPDAIGEPERAGDLLLQVRAHRHLHQGRDRHGADDVHAAAAGGPAPAGSITPPQPVGPAPAAPRR